MARKANLAANRAPIFYDFQFHFCCERNVDLGVGVAWACQTTEVKTGYIMAKISSSTLRLYKFRRD